MVDVATKVMTPGERMKARIQRVKNMKRVEAVRVEPQGGEGYTADDMRRLLKHPTAGGFRQEGSIEWPYDNFTKKRIRDGTVKLVENRKSEGHSSHHRRHEAKE
jgi:hypothetical protein